MFIEKPIKNGITKQRRAIAGVGINDAPYITSYKDSSGKTVFCPFYLVWKAMIVRCFDVKILKKYPTYTGTTIDESWKTFSNFKKWMQSQKWQGKQLDKDLLSWSNKHYGPDTCLFISQAQNSLLTLRNSKRGDYPLGVSKVNRIKQPRYIASGTFYGKPTHLGYFKTVDEAAEAYKTAKLNYIKELAEVEQDPRIKQALLALH